jgi:hypothetical protein
MNALRAIIPAILFASVLLAADETADKDNWQRMKECDPNSRAGPSPPE